MIRNWYYEYLWLDSEDVHYLPDFYIPKLKLYIEVKGREKEEDMLKLSNMRKKFNIVLWNRPILCELGIINSAGH